MTNLGHASEKASAENRSPSFIAEESSVSRRHDELQNGALSKPPSPERNLRIEAVAAAELQQHHSTPHARVAKRPIPRPLPREERKTRDPQEKHRRVGAGTDPNCVCVCARTSHETPHGYVSCAVEVAAADTSYFESRPIPPSVPGSQIPSPPSERDNTVFNGRILLAPTIRASYVCMDVVGSGAFSTVVAARDTTNSHHVVAVKIIGFPTDDFTSMSSFRSFIVRELGILSHLHHPCIIKLVDYNVNPLITLPEINEAYESGEAVKASREDLVTFAESQQYFFLEFCAGGNLFNWLSNNYTPMGHTKTFWRLAARVVSELMVAVAHMHRQRIIHRDIKLENILLNDNFDCISLYEDPRLSSRPASTVTDFGLSKRLVSDDQLLTTKCGSQDYVSPELLMGLKYDGKLLDAWAIGVLVYSIIENRLPFDLPPPELMQSSMISPSVLKRRRTKHSPAHRIAMIDWDWYRATSMHREEVLDNESKKIIHNLQKLVEVFLVRKEKRMTVQAVLEHEDFAWIKACVPSHFYS
ncbi:hypothetical protein JCM33374_g2740 [Metschnikowia sp. JCM 33374]|nr:hypothetical protein JCM33374_g2740 [Metschnikowia sp. JCM 33374]